VAVEIVVTVFFGNQWMLDHVVVPWNTSNNIAKGSVSDALRAVSWTLTPHGFGWLWLGSLVRALVWFAMTYLLVRRLVDVRDRLGRFVGVIGAVFLAQLVALIADRLVSYPDVSRLYRLSGGGITATPSFFQWLLSGDVGAGGAVLFVLVAALVAAAMNAAVSPSETEETADETD
jgi:hypothetical protein